MAVAADLPRPRVADRAPARSTVPFLARPLTSYHLVMWSSGLLVTIGLVMVLSASSVRSFAVHGSSFAVFDKQALWLVAGLPLLAVASRLPAKTWRMLAYPMLVVSALGLFVVLVPGIGTRVSGATRWIDLGPAQLQPSEPAKLALAIWGADLLVRKQKLLRDWKHLVVPLLPVTALFVMLVMAEPDLGTTVTMILVVLSLLFVVGAPMRMFGMVAGVIVTLIGLLAVVEPYRLQRLTTFAHPFKHSQSGGYQAVQGLYALASGGWWGEGLGASRAKWGSLPNAHTDYIFAIIGEELGLVGTLAVVGLFVVLGYAGFRIAARTRDPFVRLASAAVTTWLVGQALINMGYVVGLLPVTGIPLPLISFGGTSLVLTLFAVGMLASFARSEPGVAQALAARGPGRLARATARLPFH
ncbi:MAG TPA: putative lipid II flippase FtsW, partial [Mycobacteriales bacterium]|nr:putative lipid II flippase FtsW [Mycobacteriales bacterium]